MVSSICTFCRYLGRSSNLTNIFQMGWNHHFEFLSNHAGTAPWSTSNRCNPPTPQRGFGISHKRQSGCDVGAQLEGARGARRGASLAKFGKGNPLFDRGVLQTNTFFTGFSWVFYKQFPIFWGGDFSMLKWIQWWTKNTMNIHPLVDLSQMQVYTHHTSSVWVLGGPMWLGSPRFIGHLEGVPQPYLGDLLAIFLNHLLTGMILQVLELELQYKGFTGLYPIENLHVTKICNNGPFSGAMWIFGHLHSFTTVGPLVDSKPQFVFLACRIFTICVIVCRGKQIVAGQMDDMLSNKKESWFAFSRRVTFKLYWPIWVLWHELSTSNPIPFCRYGAFYTFCRLILLPNSFDV